jgi:hypothetical protein
MPTSRRCHCQICRPERLNDAVDRKTVARVRKKGFTVIAVGTGDCDCCHDCEPQASDGPSFAYTIGLPHRASHPELVVSGLSANVMSNMLHSAADRVVSGYRFQPGTTAENLVSFWPVVADPLSIVGLQETVQWSHWFHREPVDALQLVWPSAATGIFPWQPGASVQVAAAQPESWRLPQPRVGAVAVDPAWSFPVPAETLALACTHIVDEGAPVHEVARLHRPGDTEQWQFFCPHTRHDLDAGMHAYHFAHLVRRAPSLVELRDLALGEEARRTACWMPWERRQARAA